METGNHRLTTKEYLQNKNPKLLHFIFFPKYIKPNNPGRPMVNSIGSVSEKISVFVDEHLRKLTLEYQAMLRTLLILLTSLRIYNEMSY